MNAIKTFFGIAGYLALVAAASLHYIDNGPRPVLAAAVAFLGVWLLLTARAGRQVKTTKDPSGN